MEDIEIISEHNSLPPYQVISITEFNNDPESYESELVHFPFISIDSEGWPLNEGSNGFFTISDGQSVTNVFIDNDFDIDGKPAPYNPVSMSGLGNQYDNYQLKPQSYLDVNLILDGGFEVMDYTGNGWQHLPHHWEFFPESASWGSPCMTGVRHGEQMYNSSDLFTPFSGNNSIKLWGLGGGENDYGSGSENNIFQTFEGDHLVSEGTEVSIKADLMTHIDDWLGMGQGQNNAKLFFKYFNYGENNELVFHSGKWSAAFDGSFEVNEWHHLSLKDTVPGNIDVMQMGVTYYQLNYDGGAVYVDNFSARVDRSLPKIYAQHTDVIHGETGLVDIMLEGDFQPLSAIDLTFTGFHGVLDYIEIVADESSIMGQLDWMIVDNNTDSQLLIASVGTQGISQSGKLFSIRMGVGDELESQFVPIDVIHFQGNENFTEYNTQLGGLQVVWGPESGFTSENITGAYPLTVNFNDQSMQGTYPINSWDWHFGNDSSSTDQNTSFTYLYPGEYDVTLRVEDEFGLADTTISPALVQVDTVYGDVSWNGISQAYDASMILKHLVEMELLSNLQMEVGDVSLDESISTLDASYILQYTVGLIDALPYTPDEVTGSTGDFMMEDMGAEAGMMIDVPITISNAENVNGLKGRLTYDPAVLALDTLIFGEFLNGYMIEMNEIEPGQILFAASGNQPNTETGTIANLTFEVLEGFYGESSVTLSDLRVNENEELEVGAEMTVNYVLGISRAGVPEVFALHQNYPNPFNPVTRINYDLPKDDQVKITIYDMMGRQVTTLINQNQTAGYKSVRWDATNQLGESVSAGLYMYVIEAGAFRESRKMVLLK